MIRLPSALDSRLVVVGRVVCTVVALLLFLSSALHAKELILFAKDNGAPKHFESAEDGPSGYAVEIAVEAIRRAGFTPKPVTRPWKRAQLEAIAGKGLITAFSETPERMQFYLYTEPMFVDRVVLVQHKDRRFEFNRVEDLQDKIIGIARGSNYSGDFSSYRNLLNLEGDDGHRQRLLKLMAGRIDAGIFSGDMYVVHYNARRADLNPDVFVAAEKAITFDPNHIGIPKKLLGFEPEQVKRKLDQTLMEMKVDGTIAQIRSGYLLQ